MFWGAGFDESGHVVTKPHLARAPTRDLRTHESLEECLKLVNYDTISINSLPSLGVVSTILKPKPLPPFLLFQGNALRP